MCTDLTAYMKVSMNSAYIYVLLPELEVEYEAIIEYLFMFSVYTVFQLYFRVPDLTLSGCCVDQHSVQVYCSAKPRITTSECFY